MDIVSILIGMGVGGGTIFYIFRKKMNTLIELIEDIISLKNSAKRLVESYRKAVEDGVITTDEFKDLLSKLSVVLEEIDEIVKDYEEIVEEVNE